MRCYLLRKGHISTVEFLTEGSDEELIEQGKTIFASLPRDKFDAFEVWDGKRRVYTHPKSSDDSERK